MALIKLLLDQELLFTEEVMSRNFAFVIGYAAVLVLFTAASVPATQFGTAEEAKAMLERVIAAVKEDKAKALDMFNKGEGGGSRTVTFMSAAPTPRTALLRRIAT